MSKICVLRKASFLGPIHVRLSTTEVIILNSAQLDRQLSLALQARCLQIPSMPLTMVDEASTFGVNIDPASIAQHLNMPVIQMSAK